MSVVTNAMPRTVADAEQQQVEHAPQRVGNRRQHEQGDGGGSREPVDETHHHRAHHLIDGEPAEPLAIVARHRHGSASSMGGRTALMGMRVRDDVVRDDGDVVGARKQKPRRTPREARDAEHDQHQRDAELHGEAEARRDHDVENVPLRVDREAGVAAFRTIQDGYAALLVGLPERVRLRRAAWPLTARERPER